MEIVRAVGSKSASRLSGPQAALATPGRSWTIRTPATLAKSGATVNLVRLVLRAEGDQVALVAKVAPEATAAKVAPAAAVVAAPEAPSSCSARSSLPRAC